MKTIQPNSNGLEVKHWAAFLKKQSLLAAETAVFDDNLKMATIAFQSSNNLDTDAVVGNNTLNAAKKLGFVDIFTNGFPNRPSFSIIGNNEARRSVLGAFEFKPDPAGDSPEDIVILGDWEDKNIVTVVIPQLIPLTHKNTGKARFHKFVVDNAMKLFADWEKEGLLNRITSWDGAHNARFARNSKSNLSAHSWGSAFDINAGENPLSKMPALIGQQGCVRELVEIANENGFFWGGHWSSPMDGMHFEWANVDEQSKGFGALIDIDSFEDDGRDMI